MKISLYMLSRADNVLIIGKQAFPVYLSALCVNNLSCLFGITLSIVENLRPLTQPSPGGKEQIQDNKQPS